MSALPLPAKSSTPPFARAAFATLGLILALAQPGCARQFAEVGGDGSMIFQPIGKIEARAKAEPFLKAYLGAGRANMKLESVTRWAEPKSPPHWAVKYSGQGIHTGVTVELEDHTGKARVKGFLGNVLIEDNASAGTAGAVDAFRTLEDFRRRLAAQSARATPRL
jgi:hypothetical protein